MGALLLHVVVVCIKCGIRGDSAMNRCGRCKSVFYCSRDCQVGHWKEHKQNCNAPATLTLTPAADIVIGAQVAHEKKIAMEKVDAQVDHEKKIAMEKVKCSSMEIAALRKELHEKFRISTESFVEQSEFVEALAKARATKKRAKKITKTTDTA
jgi:hypothetical protein